VHALQGLVMGEIFGFETCPHTYTRSSKKERINSFFSLQVVIDLKGACLFQIFPDINFIILKCSFYLIDFIFLVKIESYCYLLRWLWWSFLSGGLLVACWVWNHERFRPLCCSSKYKSCQFIYFPFLFSSLIMLNLKNFQSYLVRPCVSIFANLTFDFYALLDGFLFFWVFLYKLQYSVFGSIVTIGGMVGAILSGKMADLIGRRGVISLTTLLALKI